MIHVTSCLPKGLRQGQVQTRSVNDVDVLVIFGAADTGTMNEEQIVLEISIWMSTEIFLYPFCDSDWVVNKYLHKYTSS